MRVTSLVVLLSVWSAAHADEELVVTAPPRAAFFFAGSLGPCARSNPDVAGAGACGELSLGGDASLGSKLRVSGELGFGFMNSASEANPFTREVRSSGTPGYASARLMFGYDFSPEIFLRGGPQVRATWALGRVDPGVQLVLDVGTRLGSERFHRLELAVRTFGGIDGVASTVTPRWSPAGCGGAMLLVRWLL
jgi:hypothetical protein